MAMQDRSSTAPYSPHVVGVAFVNQYYQTLRNEPKDAYKFYNDSSILGRSDSNGNMTFVTTTDDIKEQLLSTDFTGYLIELDTVDSQSSHVDGVLIMVTGSFTPPDAVEQKFTQSFFLAPQQNGGYFVLNDMFRFVSASPSTKINEGVPNHDNENTQSAKLPDEPETASVKESTAPNVPLTENMPVNDKVMSPSSCGDSPVNDSVVETCMKTVNVDVEKIHEAAPTPPAEKQVTKETYASIVKAIRETPVPAPAAKPKPTNNQRPKAAQNADASASSPPKTAHANNNAVPGDKNVSKNKSPDEPGYSVFVKNLPYNATIELVGQVFGKFGAIRPGCIQVKHHQLDRFCFGFVEFESQDSMKAAIEASPVSFGSREAFVEEKRTTARVVNGVFTRGPDNGNAGGGWFQSGRGGYHGDSKFRGQGGVFRNNGNYRDGDNRRNKMRSQEYHQKGNGYQQNGSGYQQRRPSDSGTGSGKVERNDGPRQTPAAA